MEKEFNEETAQEAAVNEKEAEKPAKETPETPQTDKNAGQAQTPEETGGADTSQPDDGRTTKPENEEDASQPDGGEKSSFFNRKKKKDKKDEQIEELTDRVKRTMAEFENFRKRNEREKSQMYEMGARDIIVKMLPVVDNFERGLAAITEDRKDDALAQGMEMIYKQILTTFEEIGVKEIEAVGKPFDPNFHSAVMHEENEEAGENEIVEEFQKGYLYRDSVIRHSMVKVAN